MEFEFCEWCEENELNEDTVKALKDKGYQSHRSLRLLTEESLNRNFKSEPGMNMKTMGDRAFRAYGPVQWNKLPLSLRSLSNVEIKDSKTIKRQVEIFKKRP